MTPQRQRPTEPHERNRARSTPHEFSPPPIQGPRTRMHICGACGRPGSDPAHLRPFLPAWLAEGSRGVADHLRAFAAKYPDRFEYRDGKLLTRRGR